jgi:hypothetical protein
VVVSGHDAGDDPADGTPGRLFGAHDRSHRRP